MLQTTIILLLLLNLSSSQCPARSPTDLIQTGSHEFTNALSTLPTSRIHIFEFNLEYTVPNTGVEVAASAASFQIRSQTGIDFSIRGGQGSSAQSAAIALLINQENTWNRIRVHYLVSSRNDFFLGTFSIETFFAQRNSRTNSIRVNHVLPVWTSSNAQFTTVINIAGVRTLSSNYNIRFVLMAFNAARGVIMGDLQVLSNPPFERVDLTYVIFNTAAPFIFAGFPVGTVSQAAYQYIGIGQINTGNIITEAFGLTSRTNPGSTICVGANCPSPCVTPQICSQRGGRIVNQRCVLCGFGQVVAGDTCRPFNQINCGTNQFFNGTQCVCQASYVRVNEICYLSCGLNAYVLNNQCQCVPGFIFQQSAGGCVAQPTLTCPINYTPVNGQCLCQPPLGLIGTSCLPCPGFSTRNATGFCVCNAGYTLNATSLACILNCQVNARADATGTCVCNQGFYLANNQCLQIPTCTDGRIWVVNMCMCPPQQIIDSITGRCTLCNTPDRAINGTICVCSSTFFPTAQGCEPCIANSIYNVTSRLCVCISGFVLNSGRCARIPNCPPNSRWNATRQNCDCDFFGQFVIDGFCQSCQQNSAWNGTQCVCSPNFIRRDGRCTPQCTQNQTWNGIRCQCKQGFILNTGSCVPCDPNSVWNTTRRICVCAQGWTGNGQRCTCPSGRFVINGACVLCDINSVFDTFRRTCICRAGWFGNFTKCQRCHASCATCKGLLSIDCLTCGMGQQVNNFGRCKFASCPAASFFQNNVCRSCSQSCLDCQDDRNCNQCSSGLILLNGVCARNCQANAAWNGSQCLCNSGFELINAECIAVCPAKSVRNGARCQCIAGTVQLGGLCVDCDVNAIYNAATRTCACRQGWFGNATKCDRCHQSCVGCRGLTSRDCTSCPANFELNSNGQCTLIAVRCTAGFFANSTNQCQACLSDCVQCTDSRSCNRCAQGFSVSISVEGQSLPVSCTRTPIGPSSKISLTSSVVGNGVVYQGVAMDIMPIGILIQDCSICNNLFTITTNSRVATIKSTMSYVRNSQYWFVVTFDVGNTPFIPAFSFNIRINSQYASFFSREDMQQVLRGNLGTPQTSLRRPLLGNRNGSAPALVTSTDNTTAPVFVSSTQNTTETAVPAQVTTSTIIALFG